MTTLFISHSSKDKAWANEVRDWLHAEHYEAVFLDSHPVQRRYLRRRGIDLGNGVSTDQSGHPCPPPRP